MLLRLLRCAAFGCDLRAGFHDASAVDSSDSVVPFLAGLGGGLFYGRFLLSYRVSGLAGYFALIYKTTSSQLKRSKNGF